MSSTPVPKPRTRQLDIGKKPIPLPRTQKLSTTNDTAVDSSSSNSSSVTDNMSSSPNSGFFNTLKDEFNVKKKSVIETSKQISEDFTEKVQERKKSVIEHSKQISGDITDRVQEKKRAVIESARNAHLCVKKNVAKHFGSLHRDGSITPDIPSAPEKTQSLPPSSEIFEGISFQSPLTLEKKKKKQIEYPVNDIDDETYSEPPSFPPPLMPPPPLPDESLYDEPQSANASGSSSSCGGTLNSVSLSDRLNYEEIFPDGISLLSYAQAHGSDSDSDKTCAPKVDSSHHLHRSESWSFYDSVNRNQNCDSIPEDESIYANDSIIQEHENEKEDEKENDEPPPRPERKDRKLSNQSFKEDFSKMNILRLSEISSISVQNTLYENHILQPQPVKRDQEKPTTPQSSKITDSMIFEFDPLNNLPPLSDDSSNDLSFLESILQGDTYGTTTYTSNENHDWSLSDDESESGDVLNPPTPPKRFDSLPSEMDQVPSTKWFIPTPDSNSTTKETLNVSPEKIEKSTEKTNWMKQRLSGVIQKLVPDNSRNITRRSFRGKDDVKLKMTDKPSASGQTIVTHQGFMIKFGRSGGVEDLFGDVNPRWCYLGNGKLTCYNDNTLKVIKETINVEHILSVQLISQNRIINLPNRGPSGNEEEEFHCFEITTSLKGPRSRNVLGARNLSDRRIWMQKLMESQTAVFPISLVSDFSRAGWVYLREGASSSWKGTWLLLHNRELVYIQDGGERKNVDLRTARCIILQDAESDGPKADDNGPQMLVDCAVGGTLYIRSALRRNTCAWRQAIRGAAHNNGAALDQQQITNDNIPVIVDKCINFVYAHGSMSEGIYRHSGSGKVISDLLTEFSDDAWAVQLTKDRCSEHDVACVLKRFMRNLPEPALTTKLYPYFCKISEMKSNDEKVGMYKKLLEKLPPITYQTIKKLMSHLHFIQTQHARNQMSVSNLATVWGPTLMLADNNDNTQWSKNEIGVIADLISLKNSLWPMTSEELVKEKTMLAVLLRYHQSSLNSAAARVSSGDLQVWIYLNTPNSGDCYHVTLNPHKTAFDICRELCSKMKLPAHEVQVEESVLNGQLNRPIHYTERVLNVVLQWGYWENTDCKDNCLVLRPNTLFKELSTESQRPIAMSGELKYVDDKSKSFKNYMFEFSQAKLSYYKDKNCSIKLGEWKIEEIVWYMGYETKRNPHARWCITFFPKNKIPKRTKSTPWFGHAIAGTDRTQELRWLYAMTLGEYPQGLLPSPIHVDLIEA
ncbi:uncharacterized protein LOC123294596 [Chrysoperla carnea]|uniref:uncharacterized protein LOC123294596 n=1 Tax=Chrysoperla carnea TaxID=189513 RepID=UPI001D089BA1|nr:uncharacterized protein LOC123294596 [Chrysoperla carnea]